MLTISLIAQGLYLLASLIISARLAVRTKNAVWGGLCFYGLYVLWAILFCIVIPATLEQLGVDGHQIGHAFPEAIGVLPVIFLGWAPAIAFVTLMAVFRRASGGSSDPGGGTQTVGRIGRFVQRVLPCRAEDTKSSSRGAGRTCYPKWVGVILGFLLAGSAHFLSGRRRAGIAWCVSVLVGGLVCKSLLAVPGVWGIVVSFSLWAGLIVLWLFMLRQSYRAVRRIGGLGWIAVIVLTVSLGEAREAAERLAIHPFRVTSGSMQPTIYGPHARDVEGPVSRPSLLDRFARGERYVNWTAKRIGQFGGPYPLNGTLAGYYEYRLGNESRALPRSANVRFRDGMRVDEGDVIWSGYTITGDCVLAEKISYLVRDPKRGEIVVLRTDDGVEDQPTDYVVRRVVALPGERVRIEPPWLVVNGERVVDPPIFGVIARGEQGYGGFLSGDSTGTSTESPSEEILLAEDEYFLLGDNAPNVYDSRHYGPVPRKNIVGRVTRIYWPLNRINSLEGKW